MHKLFLMVLCIATIACSISKKQSARLLDFQNDLASRIQSSDGASPMRVFKINNFEDSILLRTPSKPVVFGQDTATLDLFVNRLYATVRDSMSLGVGIAAPQVGVLKRIIWVQRFDKEGFPFEVYFNPVITKYSELKQDCLEGCLSIPDRRDTTKTRAYSILMEYDKRDQSHHVEMVEGFTAVIFQHEIDHLNGIIYLDHLKQESIDARRIKTFR
ncbi:MAG: peptide deformylase [Saprospiraceae bacterium]|nr:peptide deformylase [Saprospiraceae bacterium]